MKNAFRKVQIIALLLVMLFVLSSFSMLDSWKYKKGQEQLNAGEYEKAISTFEELNNYEDSSRFLMYARAMQIAEDGDYELAINSLEALDDFRDSKLQVVYYQARWEESEKRHEEAAELYKTIATFRDSSERLRAQPDLALDREFEKIKLIFFNASGWNNWEYESAQALINQKYSNSDVRMYEQFYALGEETLSCGLYDSAFSIFSLLNDCAYGDSAIRMQDVQYAWAQKEIDLGKYDSALSQLDFLASNGYSAAITRIQEVRFMMIELTNIRLQIHTELDKVIEQKNTEFSAEVNAGTVVLDSSYLFDFGKTELAPKGKELLDQLFSVYINTLVQPKYIPYLDKIIIEVHTDTSGSYQSNLELSEARALNIGSYCLQISVDSISFTELLNLLATKGCSYDNPVYFDDGTVDMSASRRVEIKFYLKDPTVAN